MAVSKEKRIFFGLFLLMLLLNLNFSILRTLRTTLTVADLGGGAQALPLFEFLGALPGAVGMTWGLGRLLRRYSFHQVFLLTLAAFLGFAVLFAWGLYPLLQQWRRSVAFNGTEELFWWVSRGCALLFYVVGELWKPALIVILFWGWLNNALPLDKTKGLYPRLFMGASIGGMLAGPVVSGCVRGVEYLCAAAAGAWGTTLCVLVSVLVIAGVGAGLLYRYLWTTCALQPTSTAARTPAQTHSLWSSIQLAWADRRLRWLGGIVIADYIAYSLGEVVFLDIVRQCYPTPCAYCHFMGMLTFWGGALTVVSALFIAPFVLRHFAWAVAALVTPLILLVTGGCFFLFLRGATISGVWWGWSQAHWLHVVLLLGAVQHCLCRAAKYTLFDASKEIAYVSMPSAVRVPGKLVVDGLCARVGRGGACAVSMALITACGGVLASGTIAGALALGMTGMWLLGTLRLGRLIAFKTPAIE